MRQALAVALQEFEAAVVLVSHDRHLLRAVADELVLVDQGRASPFDGDLDDYARWFTQREAAETSGEAPRASSADQRRQRKRDEAERRNRLSPLRADVARVEKQLAQLERERTDVDRQLAAPDIYEPAQKAKLQELLQQQARLQREVRAAEDQWLAATERLEKQLAVEASEGAG
jgi:ATP-binding cassette subfamily F protein 3